VLLLAALSRAKRAWGTSGCGRHAGHADALRAGRRDRGHSDGLRGRARRRRTTFRSIRPSCAWAMPAPRPAARRGLALAGANMSSRVTPRSTSGRSATWSTRLRRLGAASSTPEKKGFAACDPRRQDQSAARAVRVRGDGSSQYLRRLLMALPLGGRRGERRGRRRARLQALRRDHAEPDAPLRRRASRRRDGARSWFPGLRIDAGEIRRGDASSASISSRPARSAGSRAAARSGSKESGAEHPG